MNKIHENKNVRQREDEGYRRWFVNDFFDIIIWYPEKGADPAGFQVCYSKNKNEKAFTWKLNEYASSHFVSDPEKEQGISGIATNVLYGHAGKIPQEIINRLSEEQGELDDTLLECIINQIEKYNDASDK